MSQWTPRGKFLLFILVVLLLTWGGTFFHFDAKPWSLFFQNIPFPVAALIFVGAYVGVTFFVWFAKDIFKIVGAVAFGPWWSTLFIWLAELANAVIMFTISRKLGRDFVSQKFHLRDKDVARVQKGSGVWGIFLLRTVPLVPYRILDLAYGLTGVSLKKYLVVSAVAMPIRIFWIQFIAAGLGAGIMDPAKLMVYFQDNILVLRLSFLYLVLSGIAAFFLSRKMKAA